MYFKRWNHKSFQKKMIRQLETIFKKHCCIQYGLFPFNYNNHFTLFIIHTIHQNNSFEQSYVFYFNSLPSFQSDTISHINIIKRISNCIGCRVATSPYNHSYPTDNDILL